MESNSRKLAITIYCSIRNGLTRSCCRIPRRICLEACFAAYTKMLAGDRERDHEDLLRNTPQGFRQRCGSRVPRSSGLLQRRRQLRRSDPQRALAVYAEAESSAGRTLPEPSPFDRLYANRGIKDEAKEAPFVAIPLTEPARARSGIYRHAETGEFVARSGEDRLPPAGGEAGKRRAQTTKGR
jgi:hypothetical protein